MIIQMEIFNNSSVLLWYANLLVGEDRATSGGNREGKEETFADSARGRASVRLSDIGQAAVRCGDGQAR